MSYQTSAAAPHDPAFLQLPALDAPPGVIPNFTNPESLGPRLIVTGAILSTFVIIALANRAYTKLSIVRKMSLDDLTISLAAIGAIVSYGLYIYAIRRGGSGRHQYEVRLGELLSKGHVIASCILNTLYGPLLWLIKGTFCLLYLQIFRPMRWLRINIYIGATLLTIFYWSFAISAFVFDTRKSGETWAELALSQRFADQNKISVWFTTGGMIADVWLLVLPLVATYKLQLHKTSRVALTVMFSTGALAVAASAAGVYYRHVLVHAEDETWHVLNVNLLNLVEIDVGLITACMPSFAKMLHHHLPPWPTLKRRLKSLALACARKGTSQNVTTAPKDFEQTYKSGRDLHLEEIPHKPDLKSGDPELESLGSVQHYIGRATPEMFDDDRVLLKA